MKRSRTRFLRRFGSRFGSRRAAGALERALGTESLEDRRLLADLTQLRLDVTDLAGSSITSISPGSEFELRGYVQDQSTEPHPDLQGVLRYGLYSAFMDVAYDDNLVSNSGAGSQQVFYPYVPLGSPTFVSGQIQNIGGVLDGSQQVPPEPDQDEYLLFTARFTADTLPVIASNDHWTNDPTLVVHGDSTGNALPVLQNDYYQDGTLTFRGEQAENAGTYATLYIGGESPQNIAYGSEVFQVLPTGPLSISWVGSGAVQGVTSQGGTVSPSDGTEVLYTPPPAWANLGPGEWHEDTFTYQISGSAAQATATVKVSNGRPLVYDEGFYLRVNPDVADAVARGEYGTGYDHFVGFGLSEGRLASPVYDEGFYLRANPDVANVVAGGGIASGMEHFLLYGLSEQRASAPEYDEGFYLRANPDVANAVAGGGFDSGLQHFLLYGLSEGRASAAEYDEAFYLGSNLDVAAVVAGGGFDSGLEHFVRYGLAEQRASAAEYDEAFYLTANPDVAAVVAGGGFGSGLEHFVLYGLAEQRVSAAEYDEGFYLQWNPDVAAAVAGGAFDSGLEHFVLYGRAEGRAAHALRVASLPSMPAGASQLTFEQLLPVVDEAVARIETMGGDDTSDALDRVTYQIVDLPGDLLGRQIGSLVQIDVDAAGWSWFVDSTPGDDVEFLQDAGIDELTSLSEGPSANHVDLLTVLMHELGHVLGHADHAGHGLMGSTLTPGTRRLPDLNTVLDADPTDFGVLAAARDPDIAALDGAFAKLEFTL